MSVPHHERNPGTKATGRVDENIIPPLTEVITSLGLAEGESKTNYINPYPEPHDRIPIPILPVQSHPPHSSQSHINDNYNYHHAETNMNHILIIGCSSRVGRVMLKQFIKPEYHNLFTIHVLIRQSTYKNRPDLVALLNENNIRIIIGDVELDKDDKLIKDFKSLHTCISFLNQPNLKAKQLRLLDIIKKAGIRKFIPSEFEFDPVDIGQGKFDLYDDKLAVRQAILLTDLDYLFIMNGIFTEFLLTDPIFGLNWEKHSIIVPDNEANQITVTSLRDVAYFTVELVAHGPSKAEIKLAGDTINYKQIADLVQKEKNIELGKLVATKESIQKELNNKPNDLLWRYEYIIAEQKGVHWPVCDSWNYKYMNNRPATTFQQAVKKFDLNKYKQHIQDKPVESIASKVHAPIAFFLEEY